ncbi:MAG: thioredoxin family protein [Planctomycetaceae bacterium]|nr:thioredoxin family protein [Planctomycetaceae bacterium]
MISLKRPRPDKRIFLPIFTLALSLPTLAILSGCSQVSQWMSQYGRVSEGAVASLSEQDEKDLEQLSIGDVKVASMTGDHQTMVRDAGMTTSLSSAPAAPAAPVLSTLPAGGSLQQELQQSNGVVLVDFYADWCGPCRRQGQILHDVEHTAEQLGARIVKVNVDDHPDLADEFQVQGIPALIAIKHGQVVQRKNGLAEADELAAMFRL